MYTIVTRTRVIRANGNGRGFQKMREIIESCGIVILEMWRDEPTPADLAEKFNA